MTTLFKIIALIFAVLFAFGAAVQYNDPDSFIWILIYAVAAFLSVLFVLKKVSFYTYMVPTIIAFIGFFVSYPETFEGFEIGAGDIKNIEEGREAYGLLIIALVMGVYTARSWWLAKKKS